MHEAVYWAVRDEYDGSILVDHLQRYGTARALVLQLGDTYCDPERFSIVRRHMLIDYRLTAANNNATTDHELMRLLAEYGL